MREVHKFAAITMLWFAFVGAAVFGYFVIRTAADRKTEEMQSYIETLETEVETLHRQVVTLEVTKEDKTE